jgi:hypothetical protein
MAGRSFFLALIGVVSAQSQSVQFNQVITFNGDVSFEGNDKKLELTTKRCN